MSNKPPEPVDHPKDIADDAAYVAALREALRSDEQLLDFNVTSRLRASRARAVEASRRPRMAGWPRGFTWRAAVSGACAAALAAWLVLPQVLSHAPKPASVQATQIEVLELLGADEPPLSEDDIDFAQWLDAAHGNS